MGSKVNNLKPLMVEIPETNKWINVAGLSPILKDHGSFEAFADEIHSVIRFINESCKIEDTEGLDTAMMFFVLYQALDAFKTMENIKS
jgi:hypothetical protein